jgi:hypothetical protein
MKNIKAIVNEVVEEGVLIEDKHFWGGSKFRYETKSGTTGFTSINLIKIIDEKII